MCTTMPVGRPAGGKENGSDLIYTDGDSLSHNRLYNEKKREDTIPYRTGSGERYRPETGIDNIGSVFSSDTFMGENNG